MTVSEFHERRLNAEWDYRETKYGQGRWHIFAILTDGDHDEISPIGDVKYESYAAEIVENHNRALKERTS
jgi:hypothetical protein